MRYTVSAHDLSRVRLNEPDIVASVLQNIAIILSTRQQSIPLHRGLGLPMRFVDKPIPVAVPLMIAEVTEAIRSFEPRAELINITYIVDENVPGKLIPIVEVEIVDE